MAIQPPDFAVIDVGSVTVANYQEPAMCYLHNLPAPIRELMNDLTIEHVIVVRGLGDQAKAKVYMRRFPSGAEHFGDGVFDNDV